MRILTVSALLVVTLVFGWLGAVSEAGQRLASVRCWQFHTPDGPYVSGALKKAREYDINTVIFSHEMIKEVSQLYRDSKRAEQLRQLAKEAHGFGLRVWIWVHELESDVPKEYISDNAVQLDRPMFWNWLQDKYEWLFRDFPEFNGIVLTFHETKYKIFRGDSVRSRLSMPDRFARMINTIDNVCRRLKKDFVVRSFLYEPKELQWFAEGMEKVDPHVMLQSKCVPHDWQPYYPHNPMIGKFPDRKLIVEFDCSSEFTGKGRIPYTCPEYFEYRWRYDLSRPGVVGYNARVDHGGYDAIYTPNEINLYALCRLTRDAKVTSKQIWRDWLATRYGPEAAPFLEKALRPSFEIVNKSYFVLEFWITNHSALPSYGYANGHLSSRTIAKWKPEEPRYREMENRLNHPDPVLLETILAEKDGAIAMADESLLHLARARKHLTSEHYADLYWRLELRRRVATVWKLHAEAFFGYKVLAEGHQVPGLRERVTRAIEGLQAQAEVSETAGLTKPPAGANEIRRVAEELKSRLGQLDRR
ncbi:MAG: hypothetical protein JSU94_15825 [Phycisphaerales bacterium]|nr:MAG: hypothetical protein JSU94_15825 [Phycisphaerales bacterium]